MLVTRCESGSLNGIQGSRRNEQTPVNWSGQSRQQLTRHATIFRMKRVESPYPATIFDSEFAAGASVKAGRFLGTPSRHLPPPE
ncbi:hypothetical protein RB11628 [Rhodopirellula baltica SH 1]|uniref:Uncharacterized protein n=1 Tax=Rhodopirellula baltica (strain DSM 10527 / NCIMB 13988 / SH1) TaxID=243090 RepID=Q7UE28_RHOBA|nr:hypothetical protein RB11628 [Rhodopirellula baltica SH 1]